MDERIDIPVHGQRKRLAPISKQPMRERQYVPNRAWESSQVTFPCMYLLIQTPTQLEVRLHIMSSNIGIKHTYIFSLSHPLADTRPVKVIKSLGKYHRKYVRLCARCLPWRAKGFEVGLFIFHVITVSFEYELTFQTCLSLTPQ